MIIISHASYLAELLWKKRKQEKTNPKWVITDKQYWVRSGTIWPDPVFLPTGKRGIFFVWFSQSVGHLILYKVESSAYIVLVGGLCCLSKDGCLAVAAVLSLAWWRQGFEHIFLTSYHGMSQVLSMTRIIQSMSFILSGTGCTRTKNEEWGMVRICY